MANSCHCASGPLFLDESYVWSGDRSLRMDRKSRQPGRFTTPKEEAKPAGALTNQIIYSLWDLCLGRVRIGATAETRNAPLKVRMHTGWRPILLYTTASSRWVRGRLLRIDQQRILSGHDRTGAVYPYQLAEFKSGMTAFLFGARPAADLGGLATIAVALLWMKLFPTLQHCKTSSGWSKEPENGQEE
jgi:hypothetical protein